METQHRIVLDPGCSDAAMDAAVRANGWSFQAIDPGTERLPRIHYLSALQGRAELALVQDHLMGVWYFLVRGEAAAEVMVQIRRSLPTVDAAEALGRLDEARSADEKSRALALATLAWPDNASPPLLSAYQKQLADPEPSVRRAAIFGVAYLPWRELRPDLERVRDADSDSELRAQAASMLSSLDEQSWRRR